MGINFENLHKSYGDVEILHGVTFEVKPGRPMAFLGRNGAGKTTTIRGFMDVFRFDSGSITIDGKPFKVKDYRIGYLPEERGLYQKHKILDQLIYFSKLRGIDGEIAKKNILELLEKVELSEYSDKKLETLSKGNQQKVQIVQALMNNPEIVILDEPFSGLDPLNTLKFVEVIRDFQKKGSMIIFSTHQIDHVESFCENLIVLEKGEVVLEGQISEIKKDYKKHSILIVADGLKEEKLRAIEGVYDVLIDANQWIVKIEDESYANEVFKYVKTLKNIMKFDVEQAKLSEIFIDKVGDAYEQV